MKAPVYGTKVEGVFACGDARTGQSLVVRTARDPLTLVRPIGQALAQIDRDQTAGDVKTMEERVALVGGRLRVWSVPGSGSEVFAHIPLRERAEPTRARVG